MKGILLALAAFGSDCKVEEVHFDKRRAAFCCRRILEAAICQTCVVVSVMLATILL